MEEGVERVRTSRETAHQRIEAQRMDLMTSIQHEQAALVEKLHERQVTADSLVRSRTSEVQHKMHIKIEEAKMKHDHHLARVAMANRALEFRKQQLQVRHSVKLIMKNRERMRTHFCTTAL
jgi:hypothetical protein